MSSRRQVLYQIVLQKTGTTIGGEQSEIFITLRNCKERNCKS